MFNTFTENDIKNDVTKVFKSGIEAQNKYDHLKMKEKLNKSANYTCDYDDMSDWLLVKGKGSLYYAFISEFYPIAFVMSGCLESVKTILKDNNIYIAKFEEPFYCEEDVLKQFIKGTKGGQIIIDDRFLDDCNFSSDDERLFYIYECLEHNRKYVTPYNFTFEEIR
ncbi:MAG: hypothetical protein K2K57_12530 [Oscillospiraceae bacterium]|nr:hypothetical protein [Oscillospiraceae bacterium]